MRDQPQDEDEMKQLGERPKGQGGGARRRVRYRYHEFELVVVPVCRSRSCSRRYQMADARRPTRIRCWGDWVHRSDLWCAGRPGGDAGTAAMTMKAGEQGRGRGNVLSTRRRPPTYTIL